MPNAPEENDQQDSFEVPPEESRANYKKKQRGKNKTPFKAFEQCAIAIGPDHPRQVMSHGAKCSDKQIDVLRAPARRPAPAIAACRRKESSPATNRVSITCAQTHCPAQPGQFADVKRRVSA